MKREIKVALISAVAVVAAIGWSLSREWAAPLPRAPLAAVAPGAPRAERRPRSEEPVSAPLDAANAQPAANARASAEAALQTLRSRFTDPAQQSAELQRIKTGIEQTKGRLFQRLAGVPSDKLERLKAILAESEFQRRLAMMPTRVEPTAEDQRTIAAATERILAERQRQVSELLGPDAYEKYAAFENAEPYRNTVDQIANTMRARGATISGEQEEALLDAYTAAFRSAAQPGGDTGATNAGGPSASERGRAWSRFDETLAAQAASILPPAQLKLFMDAQYAQENASAH